jgi:hypothetical protein
MPCLRCGSVGHWEEDERFCSVSCKGLYYSQAGRPERQAQTLDDIIFDTLVADYPGALEEWGKQTGTDIAHYRRPERAEIYAEHLMRSPFGAGHGIGLRAAHSDYSAEYPPLQRTPLQERLRAKIAKWIAPTFKTNQQARADAYARARVDLLDAWAPQFAVAEVVQAHLHAAVPEHERAAFEAEQRYNEERRRW